VYFVVLLINLISADITNSREDPYNNNNNNNNIKINVNVITLNPSIVRKTEEPKILD